MPVRMSGATSGYVELAAPAVAGTTVLELPTDSIKPGVVLVAVLPLAGVSSASVDNCFSSTYDFYRVTVDLSVSAVGDSLIQVRWRSGGSDRSTASTYSNALRFYASSNAAGQELASSGGRSSGIIAYSTGSVSMRHTLEIATPYNSGELSGATVLGYRSSGTTLISLYGSFLYNTANQNDGLTVLTDNGTLTGTVRIYGYRKVV